MAKRMARRRPLAPRAEVPEPEPPPTVNTNFKADQREAFAVKLLAQELGITPGQVRALQFTYGKDLAKIRVAAERLRGS